MGILNVATYVTVDGQYVNVLEMNQYQNKIRFLQLTGTSGTLTSQQINLLRSDNTNYIIVDNELYKCNNLQDANGDLVYTHTGADTSNNVNIKTLSITLTNNNWSIQTTPVQPKIPVANTNEAVQFAEDERQKSKNLFPNSTITGTEFYQQHLNTPIKAGTYTISALVSSSDTDSDLSSIVFEDEDKIHPETINLSRNNRSSTTFTLNQDCSYVTFFASHSYVASSGDTFTFSDIQIEEGSVATDYQPYNGAIVHEKEIEITTGDATLNTDVISSGEVSWVKQGKLVVVSFSDLKFKGAVAHNNLYFSGLPKKAIKAQTFLLHQMNAHGGSSLRCMIQKDSTQIVNWYHDVTLDTNAQYYGQLTYITDEN